MLYIYIIINVAINVAIYTCIYWINGVYFTILCTAHFHFYVGNFM